MIVVTNNYNLLLGLDFLIKININVYMEKRTIWIKHGLRNNIHLLLLNMVNMLQLVKGKIRTNMEHNQKDVVMMLEAIL
jgi:hypothetical protein